jgi:hypothetical protein
MEYHGMPWAIFHMLNYRRPWELKLGFLSPLWELRCPQEFDLQISDFKHSLEECSSMKSAKK